MQVKNLSRCVGAALFAGAAVLVLRLGYAEAVFRQDSAEAIRRAALLDGRVAPARYFERLAEVDPGQAAAALVAALAADPRRSEVRIALALEAERGGRLPYAEANLLEAARQDRQYLPAWTLANYYFRRGDEPQFWRWAQRAAALCYDDLRPLLALAHRIATGPGTVLERLGGGPRLARAEVDYLALQKQFNAAQQVARILHAAGDASDGPRFLALADLQVQAGNALYAVELWNYVMYPPLDPARGLVLTNGDLAREPSGHGFDWRLGAAEGLTTEWRAGTLVFSLSGAQPDACEMAAQRFPSSPSAKSYRLRFDYAMEGLAPDSGLHWEIDGEVGPPLLAHRGFEEGSVVFPARGRASGLSTLRLVYVREPGTVHAQGRLTLRSIFMEVLTR